ncbi:MAG: Flp pilus assembly protein CpaB [Methyloligella sp.]|nr:MAG: Flp pilus assembly protein CpaB [Methyloligella sp.]
MNKSRVLVLGIAFVSAIGAALLAKNIVAQPETEKVVQTEFMNTTHVLVAAQPIKLGDMVSSGHFRWQKWPKDALNSNLIDQASHMNAKADYDKAIARSAFVPGEAINPRKFIKKGTGGIMAALLTSGMRAVSTKIKEETAAGGFILPDDHVDVILSRQIQGEGRGSKFVSNTILTNVRVLAIGQMIDPPKGKQTATGRTATLELSPGQAEILMLANQMGDVSLALRSLSKRTQGDGDSVTNLRGGKRDTVRMFKFGQKVRAFGM